MAYTSVASLSWTEDGDNWQADFEVSGAASASNTFRLIHGDEGQGRGMVRRIGKENMNPFNPVVATRLETPVWDEDRTLYDYITSNENDNIAITVQKNSTVWFTGTLDRMRGGERVRRSNPKLSLVWDNGLPVLKGKDFDEQERVELIEFLWYCMESTPDSLDTRGALAFYHPDANGTTPVKDLGLSLSRLGTGASYWDVLVQTLRKLNMQIWQGDDTEKWKIIQRSYRDATSYSWAEHEASTGSETTGTTDPSVTLSDSDFAGSGREDIRITREELPPPVWQEQYNFNPRSWLNPDFSTDATEPVSGNTVPEGWHLDGSANFDATADQITLLATADGYADQVWDTILVQTDKSGFRFDEASDQFDLTLSGEIVINGTSESGTVDVPVLEVTAHSANATEYMDEGKQWSTSQQYVKATVDEYNSSTGTTTRSFDISLTSTPLNVSTDNTEVYLRIRLTTTRPDPDSDGNDEVNEIKWDSVNIGGLQRNVAREYEPMGSAASKVDSGDETESESTIIGATWLNINTPSSNNQDAENPAGGIRYKDSTSGDFLLPENTKWNHDSRTYSDYLENIRLLDRYAQHSEEILRLKGLVDKDAGVTFGDTISYDSKTWVPVMIRETPKEQYKEIVMVELKDVDTSSASVQITDGSFSGTAAGTAGGAGGGAGGGGGTSVSSVQQRTGSVEFDAADDTDGTLKVDTSASPNQLGIADNGVGAAQIDDTQKIGFDAITLKNNEEGNFTGNGDVFYDQSAGLYVYYNDAGASPDGSTGAGLLWNRKNVTGGNAISLSYATEGEPTIAVPTDGIQTDEIDLSISPTWTGQHTFNADMTLGMATQSYLMTGRASFLFIQGQSSGAGARINIGSADGDGSDDVKYRVYGLGTPANVSDREVLDVGYVGSRFEITTEAGGTGTLRPLRLYTGNNGQQLVLHTDGDVAMANSLKIGGTGSPSYTLDVTDVARAQTRLRSPETRTDATFSAGWTGSGWKMSDSQNGKSDALELSNLVVRETLRVFELEVRDIAFTRGPLGVTPGGGKLEDVASSSHTAVSNTFTSATKQTWTFENKNNDSTKPGLSQGDRLLAQRFNPDTQNVVTQVRAVVDETSSQNGNLSAYQFNVSVDDNNTVPATGADTEGYEFIVSGSSDTGRDSFLYFDPYAPAGSAFDGVSDFNDWDSRASQVRFRWGNLDTYYDYSSETYGFAAGDPSGDWISADTSNGVRIVDNSTVRAQLSSSTLTLGATSEDHAIMDATSLRLIGSGGTVRASLQGAALTLGNTSNAHVVVDPTTNGLEMFKSDGTRTIHFDTSGDAFIEDKLQVSTGVFVGNNIGSDRAANTGVFGFLNDGTVPICEVRGLDTTGGVNRVQIIAASGSSSNLFKIDVDGSEMMRIRPDEGISLFDSTGNRTIHFDTAGDVFIEDTLLMGSSGEITISSNSFVIDSDGLSLAETLNKALGVDASNITWGDPVEATINTQATGFMTLDASSEVALSINGNDQVRATDSDTVEVAFSGTDHYRFDTNGLNFLQTQTDPPTLSNGEAVIYLEDDLRLVAKIRDSNGNTDSKDIVFS